MKLIEAGTNKKRTGIIHNPGPFNRLNRRRKIT